ncbi:S-norcoclaurine synthase 1 [Acorus calamus]|uniref:S-norcoclaurine synthase 1 n=1 Tax=Acorus calamus TaxID=4465 RepID=A0AAV9C3C7_ACOCL|nr:S-norcoclaurine synthase 1 [Acorus calamus]
MDSETPIQIPVFDLSKAAQTLAQGARARAYNNACRDVCEALARFGCFEAVYDGLPDGLRDDMFEAMRQAFDLPEEAKRRNTSDKPYFGHNGRNAISPLFESLGVEGAEEFEKARAFTQLLWPGGNNFFCETLNAVSAKLLELNLIVTKMIFHGLGVPYDAGAAVSESSIFRVMKYDAPSAVGSAVVLVPHTDKNTLTLLVQQGGVQGLEVLVDGDRWVPLAPRDGYFIVIAGEILKAWSNGRLTAAKHRVVLTPEKDRYSFGLFTLPEASSVVEPPEELVDEAHPPRYKPFEFLGYLHQVEANARTAYLSGEDSIDVYATATTDATSGGV